MTTYTKSLSSDFGANLVRSRFHREIVANATITVDLVGVQEPVGDDVNVIFTSALSGPEQTALNGLAGAHAGTAADAEIRLDNTGTANTWVALAGSQTANITITLPDASTTMLGTDTSQTITNKVFDADNNTLSNVDNADIKSGAAIDAAKIHNGTVSNTEFGHLNGVTSAIQTQLNGTVHTTGTETVNGEKTFTNKFISHTVTATDNFEIKKSNSTTHWLVNAGRSAFYDNWLLFKNEGEGGDYTFAITNSGQFRGKDGSAGGPTYTFDGASNYGMSYDSGANEGLVLSTEGVARLRIEDDGTLSVAGTTNYETLVTADDDIPNKKYVDDSSANLPTTTKGDFMVHNGSIDVRLPVGTDSYVLTANSAVTEGVEWSSVGGTLATVQARRTTAHTITSSWTTITFDTTDVETDAAVVQHNNTNTDRIDIIVAGVYEVYYHVDGDASSGSFHDVHAKVLINGSTLLDGSESSGAGYGTTSPIHSGASRSIVASFSASDYVTLQVQFNTAAITGSTVFDPTFRVKRMEGVVTGPTGSQGAQGTKGLNWQGAWATSTGYSVDDDVENDGSAYVCTSGHTSGASTEPGVGGSWGTVWDLLAQKGDTGATGAQGPTGSGSNVTVKDEGTNVTNTPHSNLNFVGAGVSVADGGSGTATITIAGSGANDVTAASNMAANKIIIGDDGAKGVKQSNWSIDSNDVLSVSTSYAGYIFDATNTLSTGGGNGFKLLAGETLGDIAFHIADRDDTFQIAELESDQGFLTLGKTYAQTLSDNGTVYGVDLQHPGNAKDFNTQSGTYRIGGVSIVMPSGGTTGQVLQKINGTNYNTQWATPTGGYKQFVTASIGTGTTSAELGMDVTPTISTGAQIATLNITPSSTSNKVLLSWRIIGDISADRAYQVLLFRGSTFIGFDTVSGWKRGYFGSASSSHMDSPATTSSTTYSIRIAISPSGTIYYGQNQANENLNGTLASKQFFNAAEISIG